MEILPKFRLLFVCLSELNILQFLLSLFELLCSKLTSSVHNCSKRVSDVHNFNLVSMMSLLANKLINVC